jgi:LuxR family maltose regulon positive regulatory protein
VTGLRLATLSVRHRAELDDLLASLQGDSHYLQEYLLSEVLARQPREVQDYMLRTSILERFCAPLCEALVRPRPGQEGRPVAGDKGRLDGSGFLEWLQRAELFLVPLDAQRRWVRYHHLFRELLQHQLRQVLGPDEVAGLHARASGWYAEQGLVDEALKHALAAGDTLCAAQIVEQNRQAALNRDQWPALTRWLARLPDEVKQRRPELLLAQAWLCMNRLDLRSLPALLEAAEEALAGDESCDPLRGEIDFFRGFFCTFEARGLQAENYLAGAISKIPETHHCVRAEAELHYALALHMNGQGPAAVDRLNGLIHARQWREGIRHTRLWAGLYFMHLLDGNLSPAIYAARQVQEIASADHNLLAETFGSYGEAWVDWHRNDVGHAVQRFEQLAAQRYVTNYRLAVDSLCALTLAYQWLQRPQQADASVRLLREYARQSDDPTYRTIASSFQARLSLLRGDTASAVRWLRTVDLSADAGIMLWWLEVPRLTECRVLMAQGSQAGLQQAIEKLARYERENQAVHNTCQRVVILPLLALAHQKLQRLDPALDTLGRAVALAQPGGFMRPFVELGPEMADLLQALVARGVVEDSLEPAMVLYLNQVLAAFPQPIREPAPARGPASGTGRHAARQAGLEPLTQRESQALRLLATDLTTDEIASEMVVSVATVRTYAKRIYGKLEAHSRFEAVQRAQELGLL